MFNLGAGEIALISVVALLLLGPDKLPELARGLGKFFREFRKHTDDVRVMVEREFYRMDQDVLADKKPPSASPEVSRVDISRFGLPLNAPGEASPQILPPPSFPPFPAPDGVVASRPPVPAPAPAPDSPAPAASADTPARSEPHADVVPGRDA
jgi:sec-independent protein translocase protein TatB